MKVFQTEIKVTIGDDKVLTILAVLDGNAFEFQEPVPDNGVRGERLATRRAFEQIGAILSMMALGVDNVD